MNCESTRERAADLIAGGLEGPVRREFELHLQQCGACRSEVESARQMWEMMGGLPAEEPGPAIRARFLEMLAAYQHGLEQGESRAGLFTRVNNWLAGWWPGRPVVQFGVAMALLVIGFFAGAYRSPGDDAKLAQLTGEVQSMRQLVALSLLQQQSASDRLKGINYAYTLEQTDSDVTSALLHTVKYDPNDNVRLAAVDALYKFTGSPAVRRGLRDALENQPSPLVQMALIELMSDLREPRFRQALQQVAANPNVAPEVRARAERALREGE
jgi:hypothetical protein